MDTRRARRLEVAIVAVLLVGGLGLRFVTCSHKWVFAGSDSYGYIKLADELVRDGRYALGPAPEPLHWARPPLYPMFIALVKGSAVAEARGGPGWWRIECGQILVDVFVNGLLVFFLARRLMGEVAGYLALGLAMVMPYTMVQMGAALTECLAMALTTATLAALVLGRHRPRRWFVAAGALAALSTLLRADGILLGAAFVPAIWLASRSWRERAIVAALAAGAFAVVFAPWPIRNLARFGAPHAFGTRVDRYTRPVLYYQGEQRWLQSFARDWKPLMATSTCLWTPGCHLSDGELAVIHAYDGPEDLAPLRAVLTRLEKEGATEAMSQAFDGLADDNRRRHPVRVLVGLPLERAWHMWADPFEEILQKPPPWGAAYRVVTSMLPIVNAAQFALTVIACVALVFIRRTREAAIVIGVAIAFRTAALAWGFYCLPRYVREVQPASYALIAALLVAVARGVRERARVGRGGE